jgi:hypothetical protein
MGWHDVYREARARAQEPQRSSCSIGDIPAGVRKCWPSLTWTNEQQIEMFSSWVSDLVIVETGSSTLADAALNVPLRSNEYSDVIEVGRFPHAWISVSTKREFTKRILWSSLVMTIASFRISRISSIWVSNSGFSVARDDHYSFMKSLSQRMSHRA